MKKIRLFLLLIICMILVTACKKQEEPVSGEAVYYLNKDGTAVVAKAYDITGETVEKKVEELLMKLEETPETVEYRRTIPENVTLLKYTLDRKQLYLDFSSEYLQIDKATEVLIRAALVKTMVQVEEISFVGITVAGEPLKDSKGKNIGLMKRFLMFQYTFQNKF